MKVQFLGAAQTVTGSCYMMQVGDVRFAVDCGMHQGNNEIEKRNRNVDHYDAANVDFFLVTHAHIDHTGLLPRMVQLGFEGKIYATSATKDLLEIMLLDSAHIQEMEAAWTNKKRRRHGQPPLEPLYTQDDAIATSKLFQEVAYEKSFEPAPGIKVTYKDAGHILGSAFIELFLKEDGKTYRLIFSGDLGRPNQLLLRDPSEAGPTDYVFLESTYGDRNHKNEQTSRDELAEAIAYSHKNGEKVIIPAFAVERTQEILYSLYMLHKAGKLPEDMPVYLDSPLAIRATEIFRKHPEYFDEETQALLKNGENPLELPDLRFTLRTEESQAINTTKGAAIVISASGMCNAGRIKHHLRHNLWRKGASVVFVGYQAKGTPGRRIVDGAPKIRIFGEDVAINAKVFTIGGFSAHAGQSQILDWLDALRKQAGETPQVFLVHGEVKAQKTLAGLIKERMGLQVHIPGYLEECTLEPGQAPEVVEAPERIARPGIDWEYVLGEYETKLTTLKERLERVKERPWEDQVDVRERLFEISSELSSLISEL